MIIAITGSIGAGKSEVADYLAAISKAEHCDTDVLCRDLLEKDQPGWLSVVEKWGNRFLEGDGSIDRSHLRIAIFEDQRLRRELENMLHPHVQKAVNHLYEKIRSQKKMLIVEVPLLFEVGWQNDFNCIVTVFAKRDDCIQRVMARDAVPAEQAEKVYDSQMDIHDKMNRSDCIVDNSTSLENMQRQVKDLYRDFHLQWSKSRDIQR